MQIHVAKRYFLSKSKIYFHEFCKCCKKFSEFSGKFPEISGNFGQNWQKSGFFGQNYSFRGGICLFSGLKTVFFTLCKKQCMLLNSHSKTLILSEKCTWCKMVIFPDFLSRFSGKFPTTCTRVHTVCTHCAHLCTHVYTHVFYNIKLMFSSVNLLNLMF